MTQQTLVWTVIGLLVIIAALAMALAVSNDGKKYHHSDNPDIGDCDGD